MPLISVIVPVYKVEPYLHQCVDSILNQTFKDFELILVDDGSPDNCPAICDEYAKQDNRVKVIHKENGGLSSARNAGLDYVFANSNSEYISFIDSDDYVDEKYLSALSLAIIKNKVDVAMCGIVEVKEESEYILDSLQNSIVIGKDIFDENNYKHYYVVAWAKLFCSKSIYNVRFREGYLHEDEFFANDYYANNIRICTIDKSLYYYRTSNSESITNKKTVVNYIQSSIMMLDRVILMKRHRFSYSKKSLSRLCVNLLHLVFKSISMDEGKNNRKDIRRVVFKSFFVLPILSRYFVVQRFLLLASFVKYILKK